MRKITLITCLLFPYLISAQVIDWGNFNEERMNEAMFTEMNKYVKSIERRDSVRVNPEIPESKYRAYDWHDYYSCNDSCSTPVYCNECYEKEKPCFFICPNVLERGCEMFCEQDRQKKNYSIKNCDNCGKNGC